jgi:PTEN induced putative kinase 1
MLNAPDNKLDPIPICKHLSDMFSAQEHIELKSTGQKVEDYDFGHLIATGCDAAVYEAISKPSMLPAGSVESLEDDFEVIEQEAFELVRSDSEEKDMPVDGELDQPDCLPTEAVCIKVMFNYGISSNSTSIERAMRRELVPALPAEYSEDHLCGAHVKKRKLPAHANIVPIHGWFVDRTPLLEGAVATYPIALPLRLCEDGCGRNSTLFIVMKRFESSLADYLHACGPPDVRDGMMLLLQLVHGIQHLQTHNIAHRDLKSDNLLLDWTEGHPQLVISDFGHCMTGPLLMPYPNDCMDKGGNGKLMAPEIALAQPGPARYLDFRSSDVWAAGTIAYEIFSGVNPFYSSAFDGRFYMEADLPPLPPAVPASVERIVRGMLARDPKERMSSAVASNVLAVLLWGPPEWQSSSPAPVAVVRWLLQLSAAVLLGVEERQQMALFLAQLQWCTLCQALELLVAGES